MPAANSGGATGTSVLVDVCGTRQDPPTLFHRPPSLREARDLSGTTSWGSKGNGQLGMAPLWLKVSWLMVPASGATLPLRVGTAQEAAQQSQRTALLRRLPEEQLEAHELRVQTDGSSICLFPALPAHHHE